jgi:hypothetical protein
LPKRVSAIGLHSGGACKIIVAIEDPAVRGAGLAED